MFTLYNPMDEGKVYFDGAGLSFELTSWKSTYYEERTYSHILDGMPIVCTDIVWINPEERSFYLPWRNVYAVKGPWGFGGRQRRGESPRQAAVRLLQKEIKFDVNPDDLLFVQWVILFSKYRKQQPQENGVHDVIFRYCYCATDELVNRVESSLDSEEYEVSRGIQKYDRNALNLIDPSGPYASNRNILLEDYDRIFGPENSETRKQ